MKCVHNKEIEVFCSENGYYLGTFVVTEEGDFKPYCRISGYYRTEAEARNALAMGFAIYECAENEACAKLIDAKSCFNAGLDN